MQIWAYLGKSERFDRAIGDFAEAFANQTERDHAALCAAVESGRLAEDDVGALRNVADPVERKKGGQPAASGRRSPMKLSTSPTPWMARRGTRCDGTRGETQHIIL